MMIGVSECLPLGILQSNRACEYAHQTFVLMYMHTDICMWTSEHMCAYVHAVSHSCSRDACVCAAEVVFSLRLNKPPDLMAMLSLVTTWACVIFALSRRISCQRRFTICFAGCSA